MNETCFDYVQRRGRTQICTVRASGPDHIQRAPCFLQLFFHPSLSCSNPPSRSSDVLQALAIVLVRCLAGIRRSANSWASPPLAAALAPMRRSACGAGAGTRASAGTCASAAASTSARAAAGAAARTGACGAFGNLEAALAAAAPALDSENLVVQGAEVHAGLGPCVEVVLDGDGAAGACARADGDVLLEGRGALDRGLVDLLVLPNLVCAAVACQSTLLCA